MPDMHIRLTDATSGNANEHLVGARLVQVQVLDLERFAFSFGYGRPNLDAHAMVSSNVCSRRQCDVTSRALHWFTEFIACHPVQASDPRDQCCAGIRKKLCPI